jgi:hypothetical protein
MKSYKHQIMEAYKETLIERAQEAGTVKKDDVVQDAQGQRYLVLETSENFEDVQQFDESGQTERWIQRSLRGNTQGKTWIAVQTRIGPAVLPYGEDGVSVVGQTTTFSEQTRQYQDVREACNDVMYEKKAQEDCGDKHDDDYKKMTEKDVSSEKDLKEFANTMAKAAFGDKVDSSKVDAIVKAAIDKSDGDWGAAVGFIKASFEK